MLSRFFASSYLPIFDLVIQHRAEFVNILNEDQPAPAPAPAGERRPAGGFRMINTQEMAKNVLRLPEAQRGDIAAQLNIPAVHFNGLLTHMQHIPPRAMAQLLTPRQSSTQIVLTQAEQASVDRVCLFSHLSFCVVDCAMSSCMCHHSWYKWASPVLKPSKLSSRVTRTRNWLPTFYSIILETSPSLDCNCYEC